MAKDLDKIIDGALSDGLDVPVTADDVNRQLYAREGYAWALDVFWAYEHMGERVKKDDAGPGRYALWKFAREDPSKFIGQILPKAMSLLEKARDKEGDDQVVVEAERKGITELRLTLKEALAEMRATDES